MERNKKRKKQLLKCRLFYSMLLCGIVITLAFSYKMIKNAIPDVIMLSVDDAQEFHFDLPVTGTLEKEDAKQVSEQGRSNIDPEELHLDFQDGFSVKVPQTGDYTIRCKLFGVFDLKEVKVEVTKRQKIVPCGIPVGIYMETKGILIIGTGKVHGMDGVDYEPAKNVVKSGDYITKINGTKVHAKAELLEKLKETKGKDVVLTIDRGGEQIDVKIRPIEALKDQYQLGIWVRDNAQGIGTMTYLTADHTFGALGHGISDVDTNELMNLSEGILYETDILSVEKGKSGTPGELLGVIDYADSKQLGTITKNTGTGIFGAITKQDAWKEYDEEHQYGVTQAQELEIAYKQEIEKGNASIRCDINGTYKEYAINITQVDLSDDSENKGIVFEVTDPELLEKTGGIVQGMSGSPILQNGRVIGAVTHVFIDDSAKGYGVFIENMIEESEK